MWIPALWINYSFMNGFIMSLILTIVNMWNLKKKLKFKKRKTAPKLYTSITTLSLWHMHNQNKNKQNQTFISCLSKNLMSRILYYCNTDIGIRLQRLTLENDVCHERWKDSCWTSKLKPSNSVQQNFLERWRKLSTEWMNKVRCELSCSQNSTLKILEWS